MTVIDTTKGGPLDPHPEEDETNPLLEEREPTPGQVIPPRVLPDYRLRIVDRKLEAARILFNGVHALEDALDAIRMNFHPDLEPSFLECDWDDERAERLRMELLGLQRTAEALIDAAILEELTRDEAKWISYAIGLRIREERRRRKTR